MLRSLGQRPVTGSDEDPRVAELRTAVSRLRRSLLLIAGAIGSVSALSTGLADVRSAVELFGEPPRRR